jgi:hypothetical protein
MKAWSAIGLLLGAAILATIPISPQVTPRGVELSVDQAQAVTYGRYRRVTRRAYRRAGYAATAGYGATAATRRTCGSWKVVRGVSERLPVVLDGARFWADECVESATSSTGANSSRKSATPAASSVSFGTITRCSRLLGHSGA